MAKYDGPPAEYAWCKACGAYVYRETPDGPWLYWGSPGTRDETRLREDYGVDVDALQTVLCGCND